MAIGDKVVIGDGYNWDGLNNQKVMAYMPKLDVGGQWIIVEGKSVMVESVGGVLCGSHGKIGGNIIKVSRNSLPGLSKGYNNNDFIELVPVNLERYQRVGYFLVDHVRISAS